MKTLKTIFVLLAIAIVFPCCTQQTGVKAVKKKNIGLQLYSLRDDIGKNFENINTVIDKAGQMGYKYVEAANYNDAGNMKIE